MAWLTEGVGRLSRAGAFALAALCLSLGAHAAGGGAAPPAPALLAILVVMTFASVLFAGRKRGPLAIGLALASSQWLLHHGFALFAHPAGCMPRLAGGGIGHHAGHYAAAAICTGTLPPAPAAHAGSAMSMSMSLPMAAAHAAATALLAGLLAFGERLLWRLAAWLLRRVPNLPVRPLPARPAAPCPVPSVVRPLLLTVSGLGCRGPTGAPAPATF